MIRLGQDRRRLGATLLFTLTLAACSGDPGDFCQTDADCGIGLRCSAADPAIRGVCVYRRHQHLDSRAEVGLDRSLDLPADAPIDRRRDLATKTDALGLDRSLNDKSLNDESTNDKSTTDTSINDKSINDTSLNDKSLNDKSITDTSFNDAAQ